MPFCVGFFGDFELKSLTEKCPLDFGELTILSYFFPDVVTFIAVKINDFGG